MLAQILPGFRDFRTPLVTGFLWLSFIWVWAGMPVPSKADKSGVIGIINAAGEYLSPTAFVGVLSFTAYVVGILLTVDSKMATAIVYRFTYDPVPGLTHWGPRNALQQLLDAALSELAQRNVPWEKIYDRYRLSGPTDEDAVEAEKRRQSDDTRNDSSYYVRQIGLDRLSSQLRQDLEAEIPLLATKLQDTKKELFDAYDRDRSEADFRLSIAPPLLAISIQQAVIMWPTSIFGGLLIIAIGIIASGTLALKGWNKVRQSTLTIVSMLQVGAVESKVLQDLKSIE